MTPKTDPGRFFEDYRLGETLVHATPRTLGEGERALYHALYPSRVALASSDGFARGCGLPRAPLDDLLLFHTVFGRTVPDVSLNAVANLGYAEGRVRRLAFPGADVRATSEVIGLRQVGSGKAGIVWVRTRGTVDGEAALDYVRWVLVAKRDPDAPAPDPVVPDLAPAVAAADLAIPEGLHFRDFDHAAAGAPHRARDYAPGERIDHVAGVTVEEAEHMMATRLWQNTARVHFDATHRADGRRLIYGGHVIGLARALSFDGLQTAQVVAAINAGTHANPCFAGDTVRAWSEVLDVATLREDVGALRLRTVATTGAPFERLGDDGKHRAEVLLDLDYWVLLPA